MAKRNRFLVFVLTGVMTLSLASCGKDAGNNRSVNNSSTVSTTAQQPDETTTANVDAIAAAQENMNSVTSMEAQMVMEMDMKVSAQGEEQSVESITTMDMVYFSDPLKIKMDMTMDMGELGSVSQSIYGDVAEDGNCTMYLYDGTSWQSQIVGMTDLEEYDARSNMLSVIEDGAVYTLEGMEQVDGGANAYKYSNVMEGEEMKEALLSSGALDNLSSLGLDASQIDGMLDGLGTITSYVWIDEATLYPVKYEMDMTDVMDALMVSMVEAMGEQAQGMTMNIPKMKISMTCSNYNNAADFTIPDEAKAN